MAKIGKGLRRNKWWQSFEMQKTNKKKSLLKKI